MGYCKEKLEKEAGEEGRSKRLSLLPLQFR